MKSGTFEQDETQFLESSLATAETFVDVGANTGYFSCIARKLGKRVIAFEPLPENLDYLLLNLSLNGFGDVEVFPLGLAESPGIAHLFGGSTGASLVEGWAGVAGNYRSTIATNTLDNLLRHRDGDRMVIKMDVEGGEYRVLQGALSTLSRVPQPRWLVEICLTEHHPDGVNPHFEDTFRLFWEHGYRAYTVDRERRQVGPGDVQRWVGDRRRDFGGYNIEFTSE
jgi:FkbM family methyltransferase